MASHGSKSAFVLMGDDLIVELAQPADDSSPIARDMAALPREPVLASPTRSGRPGGGRGVPRPEGREVLEQRRAAPWSPIRRTTHGCVMAFTESRFRRSPPGLRPALTTLALAPTWIA